MRVTPYTPDDDDTVSGSQHSMDEESTRNALMVVTRQPFDVSVQDPTDLQPMPSLPPDSPSFSLFKDDTEDAAIECDPTLTSLEDHMKHFFEGEDAGEDNDLFNYYLADGTSSFS